MGSNKMKDLKNKIGLLFKEEKWKQIAENYSPDILTEYLHFHELIIAAYEIYHFDILSDLLKEYAADLLLTTRKKFPNEWSRDWKHDVLLGLFCELIWRYEERYKAYMRAYSKVSDPPASLLVLLSRCRSVPGTPLLTEEEEEKFLRMSLKQEPTFEAANNLSVVCKHKGDKKEADYWKKVSEELKKEGRGMDNEVLLPDALTDYLDLE